MEKSALAGEGGGSRPPPFSLLPSRTKLQFTLQLRGQIHSLYFFATLYFLCGLHHSKTNGVIGEHRYIIEKLRESYVGIVTLSGNSYFVTLLKENHFYSYIVLFQWHKKLVRATSLLLLTGKNKIIFFPLLRFCDDSNFICNQQSLKKLEKTTVNQRILRNS